MSIFELQNFYKESISVATGAGTGKIYVTTKPVPTNGILVISPGNESLREIIRYTGTGTDSNGDYVNVTNIAHRGMGGTVSQAHEVGEPVRMNYTAEHQAEIDNIINAIVAAGAPDSSTTVKGIVKLSSAPADPAEPIAVGDNDPRLNATTGLTANQQNALAGGGDFGAPSGTNKFATEEFLRAPSKSPTVQVFTASGAWTKPAGLKYIVVEQQAPGGNGDNVGAGGGSGGYAKKIIPASSLAGSETVTIGATTTFGSFITTTAGADASGGTPGAAGTASGGDINIAGQQGQRGQAFSAPSSSNTIYDGGDGGSSPLGMGGKGTRHSGSPGSWTSGNNATSGRGYGAGGGDNQSGSGGIIIVYEYYV